MEKKESPKKKEPAQEKGKGGSAGRDINIPAKTIACIKLILGVCLLPFVYSVTLAFFNEFSQVEGGIRNYFWAGTISLAAIYLFLWEPAVIYSQGQKIVEAVFIFFKPLVRFAPYVVPIYLFVLAVIFGIFMAFGKSQDVMSFFVFLFGASLALHLIFSAKSLRSKQQDFLKANYIFGFSIVYILNLTLLALFFSLIFAKFSFINFSNYSFGLATNIFRSLFSQLFLPK